MPRPPTATQRLVLLQAYSAHPQIGWTPHWKWDANKLACAKRLFPAGFLSRLATTAKPTYVITASGRSLRGLGSIPPQRPLRATIHDGLHWLGFGWRDCSINIGEDQPVFWFDQETVDLRSARFTIDVHEDGGLFQAGALQNLDIRVFWTELVWKALARYVSERGYPTVFHAHDSGELVFWPDPMPEQLDPILALKGQTCVYRHEAQIHVVLVTDVTASEHGIVFRLEPSPTNGYPWNPDAPAEFNPSAGWHNLTCTSAALGDAEGDWCIAFDPAIVATVVALGLKTANAAYVIAELNRLLLANDGPLDDWSI